MFSPSPTTTFLDLERAIRRLPEERERGDAFEDLALRFLERDAAMGFAQVWSWHAWPGRYGSGFRGTDEGCDYVAQEHDGSLVAIQAKFLIEPHKRTPFGKLATFTSQISAVGSPFSHGLLITNATGISEKVKRNVVAKHNVGLVLRDALLHSTIDWAPGPASAPAAPTIRRDDQVVAVDDVVRTLGSHDRARLIAACGTGKTLMSFWAARDLMAERILVLLPSLALVRQFRAAWAEESRRAGWAPAIHAVCSDGDRTSEDEARVSVAEIGIRSVSTDPAKILQWLRATGPMIVFSTYQSSPQIAKAMTNLQVPPFDMVIADEAHHIATPDVTSPFRTILEVNAIRARRRLFMTATERIFTPRARKRAEGAGIEMASMDDEAKFGPLAHRITFGEAIKNGRITDYKIVIAEIADDDEELLLLLANNRYVGAGGITSVPAETLAGALALARAAVDCGFSRTISFHHLVHKGALPFADLVRRLEPSWKVAHVFGEQPTAEREEILADVLGDLADGQAGLVTNARCLGEGIDLPDLEAVAFVDPKSSVIEIVQAASRAMRLPRTITKSIGWIVVPVVIPAGSEPDSAMNGSAYERVWQVVSAMRAHDERLAESVDTISLGKGRRSVAASRFIADHLDRAAQGSLPVDIDRWRTAIGIRIVEATADRWGMGLAALTGFVGRAGRAPFSGPKAEMEDGFPVGAWFSRQRVLAKQGRLSAARDAAIRSLLGSDWSLPTRLPFDDRLARLQRYATLEGNCDVPVAWADTDGYLLGVWVQKQRARSRSLTPAQIAALDAVPGWFWEQTRDRDTAETLRWLRDFASREGHTVIALDAVSSDTPVGSRIDRWRQRFAEDSQSLDDALISDLADIPVWTWERSRSLSERDAFVILRRRGVEEPPTIDPSHAEAIVAMEHFIERELHAMVSALHIENGTALGSWVQQRRTERKGQRRNTAPYIVAYLHVLPYWSWKAVPGWDAITEMMRLGKGPVAAMCSAPSPTATGRAERAVRRLQNGHSQGRLSDEVVRVVSQIPGWSWTLPAVASERTSARYLQEQASGLLSARTKRWVAAARRRYGAGDMTREDIELFDRLPGWLWPPLPPSEPSMSIDRSRL